MGGPPWGGQLTPNKPPPAGLPGAGGRWPVAPNGRRHGGWGLTPGTKWVLPERPTIPTHGVKAPTFCVALRMLLLDTRGKLRRGNKMAAQSEVGARRQPVPCGSEGLNLVFVSGRPMHSFLASAPRSRESR
jgi:hypothetical protein